VERILVAVGVLAAFALGAVQVGSDAIFSSAGQRFSLPAQLRPALGVAVYAAAARAAQAPYVTDMLARAAFDRGDLRSAEQFARRLPDSTRRDDLLGKIAQARGQTAPALRYFVRAGDAQAIDAAVAAQAKRDPSAAYRLEVALIRRLRSSGTHPDAVAEAYWRLGALASQQQNPALALLNFRRAIALSPLSEKYLLAAGFAAYDLRDEAAASRYFVRVLSVDPASADAYAGAGMVALRAGDRARAEYDAARARANDPRSAALATLEGLLRK